MMSLWSVPGWIFLVWHGLGGRGIGLEESR